MVANSDLLHSSVDYPSSNWLQPPKSSTGQVKTCHHSRQQTCLQRQTTDREKSFLVSKKEKQPTKKPQNINITTQKKPIALNKLGSRSEALNSQQCFWTMLCCTTLCHFWFLMDAFRQLWRIHDWPILKLTSSAASVSRWVLKKAELCRKEAHTLLIPLVLL